MSTWGGDCFGTKNIEAWNEVYKEMVDLIGYESTVKLYNHFKGQQITFPIRLFNPECIKDVLKSKYDGTNAKNLAREYGYSERWIKKLVKKDC